MKYVILLAYDGTNYSGWQIQNNKPTISGTLKQTFEKIFHKPAHIIGASRTDTGVHAWGQTALIKTEISLVPDIIKTCMNNSLPKDIYIRNIQTAPPNFYPLKNLKEKIYYYNFLTARPNPFISRFVSNYPKIEDFELFKKILKIFVGKHDFRSFCKVYEKVNTIRKIDSIDIITLKKFEAKCIIIKGKGFLRHMIRRIVGAALDISTAKKKRNIEEVIMALKQKSPKQRFKTADPKGLILREIQFENLFWKQKKEGLIFPFEME